MLTDAKCRNAKCPADKKQARFADSGGMYLQISPTGSKRWFLKYRVAGVEKQFTLGSYPDVSLTAGCKARDAAKLQKSEDIDPLQARQVEKLIASVGSGDTLTATANDWLERGKPNRTASHYVRETRNITKDLMPYLGKRLIGSTKPTELLAVIQKVEARGALDVAHRVLITAHGVWCHAVATGRAERDITHSDNRTKFFSPGGVFLAVLISRQGCAPASVTQTPAAAGEFLPPSYCLTAKGTTHRPLWAQLEPHRVAWLESMP